MYIRPDQRGAVEEISESTDFCAETAQLVDIEIGQPGDSTNDTCMQSGAHGHAAPPYRRGSLQDHTHEAKPALRSRRRDQSRPPSGRRLQEAGMSLP